MSNFFKNIITPPTLGVNDFETETRSLLAYRMSLFMTVTIGLVAITSFVNFSSTVGLITIATFVLNLILLFYIRNANNSRIPSIIFCLFGAAVSIFMLYYIDRQPIILLGYWIVINIFFAFIVLGARFGILLTIAHATSVSFYYTIFDYKSYVNKINDINETPEQTISTVFNILVCFAIIAYINWMNIRTNEIAKQRLNEAQDVLQLQYNIISKQNTEKTVMLKEIHHRVKNNLQIITSLLRLQSRELENPEAIAKFKDATHRVIAMSMIHEKMYQSDELSTLSMGEYLEDLSQDLLSSYQSGYDVKLKIECDVDSIGLKSIVPIALILNELISNSLKYAFDDNDNCMIYISFMKFQDVNCKLIYKDSGTWKAPSRQGSFGMDLIESLTYQLEGTIEITTFPETIFEITFTPQKD